MNRKSFLIGEIVILGLAAICYWFIHIRAYSRVLGFMNGNQLCSTGRFGGMQTQGLVNCYSGADRYGIYLVWLFIIIAFIFFLVNVTNILKNK